MTAVKPLAKNTQIQPNSAIYKGMVRHRRYAPKSHHFTYQLYMLAFDVDEVMAQTLPTNIFSKRWLNPIRFNEADYLIGEPGNLKARIVNKVKSLGGLEPIEKVMMLAQTRCFGLYFSPVNFYFCYGDGNNKTEQDWQHGCRYMLAEVSNTPWNQRHYYLVDLEHPKETEKAFHVSPFMDLDMKYRWQVKAPSSHRDSLLVHIENHRNFEQQKLFEATLALKKVAFTEQALLKTWLSTPLMTLKIVWGIYWQAAKLFVKGIPFISYQSKVARDKSTGPDGQ
ncbi:DUF1365 domain-containing protein [Thalassotalea aquiviva]|uniref:DUF1365 domain-containing protein n=1 Tax=Thalassotalea aquiviva TaxID=3242415 RepID=UPI00352BBD79